MKRRNTETRRFDRITRNYLDALFELFPQLGGKLGLEEFDAELGENHPGLYRRYIELLDMTLRQVESLSPEAFEGNDFLDRRGFLSWLRTELLLTADLERWRNNPQIHCDAAIGAVFELVVRDPGKLGTIRGALESRLKRIPRFLDQAVSCLQHPVPLWAKLAVQSCAGAQQFLRELEKPLTGCSPSPRRTRRLLAEAGRAFASYARAVERRKPGPANGFSIGSRRFEFLIRERLGLDLSIGEAEAIGEQFAARLQPELDREARKLGAKNAWEALERAREEWKPEAPTLLEEYRNTTRMVKAALMKADLVTIPSGEKLRVLPVPEFLRHAFPTAAYNSPPPFARKQHGIFWVNDLGRTRKTRRQQEAEVRQHFGLELTCAHEAYPGHHLQFVIQNRHPSRIRRLMHHAVFYEGWTLWCEKMCVEKGIYRAPHARLVQLHDALWRANRILIDCGLHSGRLSFKGATDQLVRAVGFTRNRAAGDVNWYTSAPAVPMSYLIGRWQLEQVYNRLVRREKWGLKRFNDWALSFGAIPWTWIWRSRLTEE